MIVTLRRTGCSVLLAASALASCSQSAPSFEQPKASTFQAGTCRTVADQILSVGRDARQLGTSSTPPAEVRARLKAAQEALAAVRPNAEPALAKPLDTLVVSIGLVRIRSDGNTYTADLGTSLSKAYEAVVATCTAPS